MDKALVGNIGNAIFRHFVIYLDYKNQQLMVEKGKHFEHRFPEDKSGVQVMVSDHGKIEVVWIAPGTPGEKAGFKKGDIIKTINGTDVNALDGIPAVLTVRKLFKRKIGTRYNVTVSRNGKQLEIQLELRDLYQTP